MFLVSHQKYHKQPKSMHYCWSSSAQVCRRCLLLGVSG
jgi:hypothetical protein